MITNRNRPNPRATRRARLFASAAAAGWAFIVATPHLASAQVTGAVLTDKIFQGQGVIDILKDVSGASLQQYLDANGKLLLGIDVNEAASGNESADSQGIAIKSLELAITTTAGDFTFSDFYTSTTATLLARGATVAQDYYTVFGTSGSNSINGGTQNFDMSAFDDVIYLDNVSFTGQVLSASLTVRFLDTANTGSDTNESFFDYSNGFEDFAILTSSQASALEAANLGVADAPDSVTFETVPVEAASPPGAPSPPLALLLGLGAILLWKARTS